MCNLYSMTSKGEAERFLGQIGLDLKDYDPAVRRTFNQPLAVLGQAELKAQGEPRSWL